MKSRGFAVGDPRAQAAGRHGGKESARQRLHKRLQAWKQEFPNVSQLDAERIYRKGYAAGHAAVKKESH